MKQNVIEIPAEYIKPLNLNGLNGRYLHIKSNNIRFSNKEYLVLYGHHSSLERMYSIAQNIADFGNVTVPDIPGFGGMDSFYVLGKKPTLENYADYLASFIKLKYRGKRFSIAGMSFGFLIITKMLQKYPELINKVDFIISLVGFTDVSDLKISKRKINELRFIGKFFSGYVTSKVFTLLFINSPIIKNIYRISARNHPKMKDAHGDELNKRLTFEVYLWKINDIRTYMFTTNLIMNVAITDKKVDHQLMHVDVDADQYFDKSITRKNLKKVYKRVSVYEAKIGNHAPTVISSYESAKSFIPNKLRKELNKQTINKSDR